LLVASCGKEAKMKYVASCSCGKDSLAMVLTLIEKKYPLDYVIFVDLGNAPKLFS